MSPFRIQEGLEMPQKSNLRDFCTNTLKKKEAPLTVVNMSGIDALFMCVCKKGLSLLSVLCLGEDTRRKKGDCQMVLRGVSRKNGHPDFESNATAVTECNGESFLTR
ncbi:hypothetical protein TNIN_248221 [Trichonephila inaurata madagascariensis]|uniref:Uncharacterized protein n=1 Tax=Trichonephila inaurata madagascariensis TaxID=2747483 RepID=A0A8X6Y5K0_9ARAC|nr:hypothetical protein TNIN_248221 [Trichonephila inaurata madagascariensis]